MFRESAAKNNSFPCDLSKGKTAIIFHGQGAQILRDGKPFTSGVGLNCAINTCGLWTDSSKATWKVIGKTEDSIRLSVAFWDLPVSQEWLISLNEETNIRWEINLDCEEWICIDEMRFICLLEPEYKSWFCNQKEEYFGRLNESWQDLYSDEDMVEFIGVRFCAKGFSLPAVIIKPEEKKFPGIVQNAPFDNRACLIGLRTPGQYQGRQYRPGQSRAFLADIEVADDHLYPDKEIEKIRRRYFEEAFRKSPYAIKHERKIKILLANLPWQRDGRWGVRAGSRWPHIKDASEGKYMPFPFFLAYAAALLKKNGIEATVIDAIAEQISEATFLNRIFSCGYDYILAETSVPSFYDDMRLLKKIAKAGLPVILCGPNSEIYKPQFLAENSFVDFVLSGEYEFTALELISALQSNRDLSAIKGIIYREDSGISVNQSREPAVIDSLPWPHRDTLPMDKYWDLPGDLPYPSAQMLASRGCPFGCSFCLWPQVLYRTNNYRARDVKDVVDEMEYLVSRKGFKSVYFDDDTFNIGKSRMMDFCKLIKSRGLQAVPWAMMARADLMDEEILQEMKSTGLWAVKYGVESRRQSLVDSCNKNLNCDRTEKIIRLTKELGIRVHLTFCLGFSGEDAESINETVDYAISLDPHSVQFSILTPFPGTQLFEQLDVQNRIITKDWSKYDGHYNCVFQPDKLDSRYLKQAKDNAYRLWGEHLRKRRGLRGDIKRFKDYLKEQGFARAVQKAADYMEFVFVKKNRYLNGKD